MLIVKWGFVPYNESLRASLFSAGIINTNILLGFCCNIFVQLYILYLHSFLYVLAPSKVENEY